MRLLEVRALKTFYKVQEGLVRAVDGVSFGIEAGSMVGLVGESGCGKTTVGRSIIRVLPRNGYMTAQGIMFKGRDLTRLTEKEMRLLRWTEIAVVPQSAMNSLDPVYCIEDQMLEVLTRRGGLTRSVAIARAAELFNEVGLDPSRLRSYPHELSGGMKQRAIIAMAIALKPSFIIADEPVTALDVIVQDRVLKIFKCLQQEMNITVMMITHDMSVIAQTCDAVIVMYAGRVVETGPTRDVFKRPHHPYTMGLKNAFPNLTEPADRLVSIPGDPPDMLTPVEGCPFADRCPFRYGKCRDVIPPLEEVASGHRVACIRKDTVNEMRLKAQEVETWQRVTPS
ncbi:MAG: ABC transporter ATP-binding protein [Candidatus Eisenbacteria bacterium]|nr:ABC transporter ATP-binding protein [Candidatus Eisenbacteria bacterium]